MDDKLYLVVWKYDGRKCPKCGLPLMNGHGLPMNLTRAEFPEENKQELYCGKCDTYVADVLPLNKGFGKPRTRIKSRKGRK